LTEAVNNTSVGGVGGLQGVEHAGTHISKGMGITLGVLAAIPAIVVPIASKGSSKATSVPINIQKCPPTANIPNCG
jgi:hypothetical protein